MIKKHVKCNSVKRFIKDGLISILILILIFFTAISIFPDIFKLSLIPELPYRLNPIVYNCIILALSLYAYSYFGRKIRTSPTDTLSSIVTLILCIFSTVPLVNDILTNEFISSVSKATLLLLILTAYVVVFFVMATKDLQEENNNKEISNKK